MSQSKQLSSSFSVSSSCQACNQKIICCQSYSITVSSVLTKTWLFECLMLVSLCEQTEQLPDLQDWCCSPMAMTRKEKNMINMILCSIRLQVQLFPLSTDKHLNCKLFVNITVTGKSVQQETKLAASQLGADR